MIGMVATRDYPWILQLSPALLSHLKPNRKTTAKEEVFNNIRLSWVLEREFTISQAIFLVEYRSIKGARG
jgi:hypothetical protein